MKTDSDENGVHLRLTRAEKDLLRALPTGLSPRTGHRREALRQLVAQKWPGPKEAAEAAIGWFDETMSAAHWLSLQDISPDRAAMLLCQHDPNSETVEQARQNTNDATGPDEFVRLVQRFEDLAKCDPRHRSLLDWLQFARASQLRYHPWIDQYVEAAGLDPDDPVAAQQGPPVRVAEVGPQPLTTGDIAFCFDGLPYTEARWKKPLGDKPKWLAACVAAPGRRGVSETLWNPVFIGGALVSRCARGVSARSVRARFQTQPMLKPWLDAWKTYEADYIEST